MSKLRAKSSLQKSLVGKMSKVSVIAQKQRTSTLDGNSSCLLFCSSRANQSMLPSTDQMTQYKLRRCSPQATLHSNLQRLVMALGNMATHFLGTAALVMKGQTFIGSHSFKQLVEQKIPVRLQSTVTSKVQIQRRQGR